MIADQEEQEEPVRRFELSSRDGDERGAAETTRRDAVQTAATLTERTGEKVYVNPEGARFTPATPTTPK